MVGVHKLRSQILMLLSITLVFLAPSAMTASKSRAFLLTHPSRAALTTQPGRCVLLLRHTLMIVNSSRLRQHAGLSLYIHVHELDRIFCDAGIRLLFLVGRNKS